MSRAIPSQIGKLLPLLGSDKDGEVIATARAIGRTLKGAGQDFHDLVAALAIPASPTERRQPRKRKPSRSWQAADTTKSADFALVRRAWEQGAAWLPDKDLEFLKSLGFRLCRWGGTPSAAQAEWLADIVARIEARRAA